MVELSIKYLSSCALTEEHASMEAAVDRINELFETYKCFYGAQVGVGSTKKLKLSVGPSVRNFVAQVIMEDGLKNCLLVIFRIEEKKDVI